MRRSDIVREKRRWVAGERLDFFPREPVAASNRYTVFYVPWYASRVMQRTGRGSACRRENRVNRDDRVWVCDYAFFEGSGAVRTSRRRLDRRRLLLLPGSYYNIINYYYIIIIVVYLLYCCCCSCVVTCPYLRGESWRKNRGTMQRSERAVGYTYHMYIILRDYRNEECWNSIFIIFDFFFYFLIFYCCRII